MKPWAMRCTRRASYAVVALGLCTLACSRSASLLSSSSSSSSPDATDAGAAAASASTSPPPTVPVSARLRQPDLAPGERTARFSLPAAEARRSRLARLEDDPALVPHAKLLREHLGDRGGPLHVQAIELEGARRALLVSRDGDDPRPFILVVDAKGAILWTKERPVAGVVAKVTHLALAPGPMGGVALVLFSAPTHAVAARMWDGDGGVFADFHLLEVAACDALSALYWPRRGWVVVATQLGVGRAQLLDENGSLVWGKGGAPVGMPARVAAPSSIAVDTDASLMLLQLAPAPDVGDGGDGGKEGKAAAPHAFAFRYDRSGAPLWEAPVDLGALPALRANAGERIVAQRLREGVVRAVLPGAPNKAAAAALEIDADGAVTR